MDHADDNGGDGDVFVYRGGKAPQHVTHVVIDKSVDEIGDYAFSGCERLVKLETHDGIRRAGNFAFKKCKLLSQINLESAVEIGCGAFIWCGDLAHVEFGDELEIIGAGAFYRCTSLKHLKLLSIVTIECDAFMNCSALIDIEFSERLETVGKSAFNGCRQLRRIAIPLRRGLFPFNDTSLFNDTLLQFYECEQLTTVDLVGGIHETVASYTWRVGGMMCWQKSIISIVFSPAHLPTVRLMQ